MKSCHPEIMKENPCKDIVINDETLKRLDLDLRIIEDCKELLEELYDGDNYRVYRRFSSNLIALENSIKNKITEALR